MAWKWSTTTLAWPSRATRALAYPAPGIQDDRADAGQPGARPGTKPAIDGGPGAVGHHLQQPTALQVDQPGDPQGWCQAGGLEEAGLVQAERDHPLQASASSTNGCRARV